MSQVTQCLYIHINRFEWLLVRDQPLSISDSKLLICEQNEKIVCYEYNFCLYCATLSFPLCAGIMDIQPDAQVKRTIQ